MGLFNPLTWIETALLPITKPLKISFKFLGRGINFASRVLLPTIPVAIGSALFSVIYDTELWNRFVGGMTAFYHAPVEAIKLAVAGNPAKIIERYSGNFSENFSDLESSAMTAVVAAGTYLGYKHVASPLIKGLSGKTPAPKGLEGKLEKVGNIGNTIVRASGRWAPSKPIAAVSAIIAMSAKGDIEDKLITGVTAPYHLGVIVKNKIMGSSEYVGSFQNYFDNLKENLNIFDLEPINLGTTILAGIGTYLFYRLLAKPFLEGATGDAYIEGQKKKAVREYGKQKGKGN